MDLHSFGLCHAYPNWNLYGSIHSTQKHLHHCVHARHFVLLIRLSDAVLNRSFRATFLLHNSATRRM